MEYDLQASWVRWIKFNFSPLLFWGHLSRARALLWSMICIHGQSLEQQLSDLGFVWAIAILFLPFCSTPRWIETIDVRLKPSWKTRMSFNLFPGSQSWGSLPETSMFFFKLSNPWIRYQDWHIKEKLHSLRLPRRCSAERISKGKSGSSDHSIHE